MSNYSTSSHNRMIQGHRDSHVRGKGILVAKTGFHAPKRPEEIMPYSFRFRMTNSFYHMCVLLFLLKHIQIEECGLILKIMFWKYEFIEK